MRVLIGLIISVAAGLALARFDLTLGHCVRPPRRNGQERMAESHQAVFLTASHHLLPERDLMGPDWTLSNMP